jgi:hypothetical protein
MSNQRANNSEIVRQVAFILVFVLVAVAGIFFLLSKKSVTSSHLVQFHVDASGGYAIITLQAGNVSISKPTRVTTPWNRTISVPKGSEVYLTASNPTHTGTLTCSIVINNNSWQKEITGAPKDGVACAGIIP